MIISSLYSGAVKRGLDKRITFEDFALLDEIHANNRVTIKQDKEAYRIVTIPMNELTKEDIGYIKQFE